MGIFLVYLCFLIQRNDKNRRHVEPLEYKMRPFLNPKIFGDSLSWKERAGPTRIAPQGCQARFFFDAMQIRFLGWFHVTLLLSWQHMPTSKCELEMAHSSLVKSETYIIQNPDVSFLPCPGMSWISHHIGEVFFPTKEVPTECSEHVFRAAHPPTYDTCANKKMRGIARIDSRIHWYFGERLAKESTQCHRSMPDLKVSHVARKTNSMYCRFPLAKFVKHVFSPNGPWVKEYGFADT